MLGLHLLVNTFLHDEQFYREPHCNSSLCIFCMLLPLLESHTALCRFFPLFGIDDLI
jgi:hypothetical protein